MIQTRGSASVAEPVRRLFATMMSSRLIGVNSSALVAFIVIVTLTASFQPSDGAALNPVGKHRSSRNRGCYYMLQHYKNGEQIKTDEPCLNCTCENSMLMCYLRVCPYVKPVGDRCIIERVQGECCPRITCPDVAPPSDNFEQELVDGDSSSYLTTTTTTDQSKQPTTTTSTQSTNSADVVTHLFGNATANEPSSSSSTTALARSGGCMLGDKFYPEGAQMPPSDSRKSACEVCYCIRNSSACVMQDCALEVSGCTPIYSSGGCCPTRYNCSSDNAFTTAMPVDLTRKATRDGSFSSSPLASNGKKKFWDLSSSTSGAMGDFTTLAYEGISSLISPSTTIAPPRPIVLPDFGRATAPGSAANSVPGPGCRAPNSTRLYADGERVPSRNKCEHCYCMRGELVCAVQECRPPCAGCVPIIDPSDQCCPKRYECAAPTQRVPVENVMINDEQDSSSKASTEAAAEPAAPTSTYPNPANEPTQAATGATGGSTSGSTEADPSQAKSADTIVGSTSESPQQNFTHIDSTNESRSSSVNEAAASSLPSTTTLADGSTTDEAMASTSRSTSGPADTFVSGEPTRVVPEVSVMTTRQTTMPFRPISAKSEDDVASEPVPERDMAKSTKLETGPTAANVDGFNLNSEREQEMSADLGKAAGRVEAPEGGPVAPSQSPADLNEMLSPSLTSTPKLALESEPPTSSTPSVSSTESVQDGDTTGANKSPMETLNLVSGSDRKSRPLVVASPIPGEGSCRYNGRLYQNGQEVKSRHNCTELCMCINSVVYCDEVDCPRAPDNADRCQKITVEGECCPRYVCPEEPSTSGATSAATTPAEVSTDSRESSPATSAADESAPSSTSSSPFSDQSTTSSAPVDITSAVSSSTAPDQTATAPANENEIASESGQATSPSSKAPKQEAAPPSTISLVEETPQTTTTTTTAPSTASASSTTDTATSSQVNESDVAGQTLPVETKDSATTSGVESSSTTNTPDSSETVYGSSLADDSSSAPSESPTTTSATMTTPTANASPASESSTSGTTQEKSESDVKSETSTVETKDSTTTQAAELSSTTTAPTSSDSVSGSSLVDDSTGKPAEAPTTTTATTGAQNAETGSSLVPEVSPSSTFAIAPSDVGTDSRDSSTTTIVADESPSSSSTAPAAPVSEGPATSSSPVDVSSNLSTSSAQDQTATAAANENEIPSESRQGTSSSYEAPLQEAASPSTSSSAEETPQTTETIGTNEVAVSPKEAEISTTTQTSEPPTTTTTPTQPTTTTTMTTADASSASGSFTPETASSSPAMHSDAKSQTLPVENKDSATTSAVELSSATSTPVSSETASGSSLTDESSGLPSEAPPTTSAQDAETKSSTVPDASTSSATSTTSSEVSTDSSNSSAATKATDESSSPSSSASPSPVTDQSTTSSAPVDIISTASSSSGSDQTTKTPTDQNEVAPESRMEPSSSQAPQYDSAAPSTNSPVEETTQTTTTTKTDASTASASSASEIVPSRQANESGVKSETSPVETKDSTTTPAVELSSPTTVPASSEAVSGSSLVDESSNKPSEVPTATTTTVTTTTADANPTGANLASEVVPSSPAIESDVKSETSPVETKDSTTTPAVELSSPTSSPASFETVSGSSSTEDSSSKPSEIPTTTTGSQNVETGSSTILDASPSSTPAPIVYNSNITTMSPADQFITSVSTIKDQDFKPVNLTTVIPSIRGSAASVTIPWSDVSSSAASIGSNDVEVSPKESEMNISPQTSEPPTTTTTTTTSTTTTTTTPPPQTTTTTTITPTTAATPTELPALATLVSLVTELPSFAPKTEEASPLSNQTRTITYDTTTQISTGTESDYEDATDELGCEYEGKAYSSAQQIPRSHPCDFCFCFRGDIICLQQTCPPPVPHCFETVIDGFCCPRYECPVHTVRSAPNSSGLTVTPFETHSRLDLPASNSGESERRGGHNATSHLNGRHTPTSTVKGCFVENKLYGVGKVIDSASSPCLECRCDRSGMMRCNPKECTPEDPLLQQINRDVLQSTLSRGQRRRR